ncbi:hypothetical protein L210DRAFT_3551298 [Boletus edulis BED1]|uniref:FAD-binding domain-containing protein n=1 Tax=Boletus edulis BED1 TaxID=1328754 RepID=A0AAD4GC28_BOLED|nr:hypothetical protein L210DRAFT_3551298 [Boletus edulis BED1]
MPLENRVDVLIVGAGPSGVMQATALAMAGVDVKIIDKRPVTVSTGHADGILPRTTENFQVMPFQVSITVVSNVCNTMDSPSA